MNGKRKRDPEATREPQPRLSEVQQQLCSMKQEVSELQKLLEERDQRLAIENELFLAEEQIRWLEPSEWNLAWTPIIGARGSQETSMWIDILAVAAEG
ncbi:golgin subfamily B member 1-like [Microtus pennsylvanicus]|uniref:golgin subfamily B member 1-like n=1 Tax=Microtus pennsylvanicus TaxID=10058 RepID=UPI003F6AF093